MKQILTLLAIIITICEALAQQGTIRGTVIEDATGEPLFGVTVQIKGTSKGSITDFDGKFEINVEPGTYDVQASFVSFQSVTITGLLIEPGKVTVIDQIRLKEDVELLEEVVVTAEVVRTTEAALLTVKRKSANLIDGISSASFRKIGDGDAASAAKRITGVNIEGGKYVFVRGLGDRYTKTLLNGMDVPGLDPDRNTLQMDIFPTSLLNNIVVSKSFTADLPADFTGGLVNIEMKDFPEEKIFDVSIGMGYNSAMHFNDRYLKYEGGDTDWLGFDNGARDIPSGGRTDIPQFGDIVGRPATDPEFTDYFNILNSFDKTLAAFREQSFMNFDIGFSLGNQVSVKEAKLGYNLGLTYKRDFRFYEDAEFSRYGKPQDVDELTLDSLEVQRGDYGESSTLIGGLAGIALKLDRSKYKINFLRLQNGESRAGLFDYFGRELGSIFDAEQHNLEFNERSLTNLFIGGEHFNSDGSWEYDWRISPTRSSITDPDVRFTRYRTDRGDNLVGTESGLPERIWRFLDEDNITGKLDVTRKNGILGRSSKVKFGVLYTFKERDFEIQNFQILTQSFQVSDENPNNLLQEENLYDPVAFSGVIFNPNFIPINPNFFNSTISVFGAYASTEFNPINDLKATVGLRSEQYTQKYTGSDQVGDNVLENENVIDDLDFFPTINLIYSLDDKTNLRFSYASTIARPSFKEASFAQIFDAVTGRTFLGSFFPSTIAGEEVWDGNIQSTSVDNYDLRWEVFKPGGQTVSVSAFYKTFDRPIEIVQSPTQTNTFQPRNVGDGRVIGGEFEVRRNLGLVSSTLSNLLFVGNVTITDSKIDISPAELLSRQSSARTGERVEETRDMAGQAPWIINTGFQYTSEDGGLEAGLYYNVSGETLIFVGAANVPDIYSVPFNSLNLKVNYTFGVNDQMRFGLKIDNILNDDREQEFQNFGTVSRTFTRLSPGTELGLSFNYSLN
ncbi:MAG: TonB-dependent receptor [Bacteroidota bacterium]